MAATNLCFGCDSQSLISPTDTPFRDGQERDLKAALKGTDPAIPLVFVSGNHDLGNTPTPATVEQYCSAWGDDYFSFWVSRHLTDIVTVALPVEFTCECLLPSHRIWVHNTTAPSSSSMCYVTHVITVNRAR